MLSNSSDHHIFLLLSSLLLQGHGHQRLPPSLQLSLKNMRVWSMTVFFDRSEICETNKFCGVRQRIDNPQSPTEHPSVLQWAAVAEMSCRLFWIKLPFITYPKLIWKSQRNGGSLSAKTFFYIYFFFQGIALPTKTNVISANFNSATKALPLLFFLHFQ